MARPTIDFEVYVNSNAPVPERTTALTELFANEDAAGIEYAVVMPSPTPRPDNRALYETAGAERRAILCCQVNPNESCALDEIRQAATDWRMRVLKLMPAIYHLSLTGPLASQLMRTARELGLLVNIHSGSEISHPLAIGALARAGRQAALCVVMSGSAVAASCTPSESAASACRARALGSAAALPSTAESSD